MNITHTINLEEIIWTFFSVIGLFFMLRLFWRSYGDRHWLINSAANGDKHTRQYVATTSVLVFLGGVITQTAYTAAGVVAMTAPNKNNAANLNVQGILTATIFITASIFGTIMAGVIYKRRVRVIRLILEHYVQKDE